MSTTPNPAALAMSAAQEIIDDLGAFIEDDARTAAIIARHQQPLVDRIEELEGELAEEKKMHAECAEDQLATFKEMVARGEALAAANERAEWAERERDEAKAASQRRAEKLQAATIENDRLRSLLNTHASVSFAKPDFITTPATCNKCGKKFHAPTTGKMLNQCPMCTGTLQTDGAGLAEEMQVKLGKQQDALTATQNKIKELENKS